MATALQKAMAMDVIYDFEQKPGQFGWFTKVKRKDVADGLRDRVEHPEMINTAHVNLCGPGALAYALCRDNPRGYATFATTLYDKGRADLGSLNVSPSVNLRVSNPPADKVNAADWIVLAGIRDSENFITDFSTADAGFGGITLPGALKDWFVSCGYSDVIEECSVVFTKDEAHARRANLLLSQGYRIALFINAQMLEPDSMNDWSSIATHWVMLNDPFTITNNTVKFTCFTWGDGNRSVPQTGTLTLDGFENNYYGFVAAKP